MPIVRAILVRLAKSGVEEAVAIIVVIAVDDESVNEYDIIFLGAAK